MDPEDQEEEEEIDERWEDLRKGNTEVDCIVQTLEIAVYFSKDDYPKLHNMAHLLPCGCFHCS